MASYITKLQCVAVNHEELDVFQSILGGKVLYLARNYLNTIVPPIRLFAITFHTRNSIDIHQYILKISKLQF